ncbi:transporter [Methylomonas sp. MgM2]
MDFPESKEFDTYGKEMGELEMEEFFKGRFNRSRARLPENIERWRKSPNAANPGADSANFPNSPFTLPEGRAYVEVSPYTYSGKAQGTPGQYNTEYLLRYGVTDDIELRLFGNGLSWSEGGNSSVQLAPIGFDTKILLWPEQQDYYLPAVGFEASVQTELLGSSSLNAGTQPSLTLNFDQSLPYDIDFGYSVSGTRFQGSNDNNLWAFLFEWAFQRDLFNKDFAVFVHGYYQPTTVIQNAVGGGFVWTPHHRFGFYGQVSAGTTKATPSVISNVGFVVAF